MALRIYLPTVSGKKSSMSHRVLRTLEVTRSLFQGSHLSLTLPGSRWLAVAGSRSQVLWVSVEVSLWEAVRAQMRPDEAREAGGTVGFILCLCSFFQNARVD